MASGGETVFARGPGFVEDDARWSRTALVGVAALPWRVRVWLPAAARATRLSWYPEWIALGGAWLTILLAVSVSAAQRASRRKRALERGRQRVLDTIEERARAELAATGQHRPAAAPNRGLGRLTPQELQVVHALAATIRAAAAALFLSPRTVEGHLGRAYAKLGVNSREALRDLVEHGR